jgi:ribosome biogenesis GTPase / thiamine phosphate phosphatase
LKRKKQPYHLAQLSHLDNNEAHKLLKQASKMRKLALSKGGRKASISDFLNELVPLADGPECQAAMELVTWVGPRTARLRDRHADLNGHRLAVGDVARYAEFDGRVKVVGVEPRRTKLSRPDVANPHLERVIVANVDIVAIVVSVGAPPLHPRLIDRYLVAIQAGGAEPFLVVNKVDLLSGPDRESELGKVKPYAELGVPVFACSTTTEEGIGALRGALARKVCAFVGHSGVGKSTLVNALFPELDLKTGALMRGHERGAHTTSTASLFEVGEGTKLIDTPGIRSFGLGKMSLLELQRAFPEFDGAARRFRDCSHSHEPGCGAKSAVESGTIPAVRHETYLRLLQEVAPPSG